MNAGTTPNDNQRGFTIVELSLAIVILLIAMGAVAMALASTLRHGTNSTGRTVASGLVTEEMETVRQNARTNFTTLPLGLIERDEDVDGVRYHVIRESEFVAESSSEDSCTNTSSGSGAAPAFLRVRVLVTWPGIGAASPANAETLLAPPIGAYDPTKGHVAVQVRGRDAKGVAGIPVALKNGATTVRTLTTTTEGCAYFAYVDPGTYTVQLSRTGYVDGQMLASPTATVTVAPTQAVSTDFDYDRQAAIVGTRVDLTGMSSPIPAASGVTVAHTSLTPSGLKSFPFTGGATAQTIIVYPYTEGYQMWGGACDDADPGLSFRPAAVSVEPRATTSGAVIGLTSQRFEVSVPSGFDTTWFRAGPVARVRLRLTHGAMSGCESGEVLEYATSAVTDSDGKLRVALPLGTWTVEVIGDKPGPSPLAWRPVGGSWPTIAVTGDPTDAGRSTVKIEVK